MPVRYSPTKLDIYGDAFIMVSSVYFWHKQATIRLFIYCALQTTINQVQALVVLLCC